MLERLKSLTVNSLRPSGNQAGIGSDNGLSPDQRRAFIGTRASILLIGPLGTNFNEKIIEIHTSSLKKMHLKMSEKWQPYYLGLNVLTASALVRVIARLLCNFYTNVKIVFENVA